MFERIDIAGTKHEFKHVHIFSFSRLTSLDMSEVDTVWTWGGQTYTPPISKYLKKRVGDTGFERNTTAPQRRILSASPQQAKTANT